MVPGIGGRGPFRPLGCPRDAAFMGTITVGVDSSAGAAAAIRWALREAELRAWSLTAVLAWDFLDQQSSTIGERFDPNYGEPEAVDALHEIVLAAAGAESASAISPRVICDLAAPALLGASSESDLLVVGARGLGGFHGLLVGSVSQQCLHHATCPVAIVRAHAHPGGPMERIVVGIDGSDNSHRALRWALDEGRLRRAAVEVVHTWNAPYMGGYRYDVPMVDPENYEKTANQVLDSAIDGEDTSGLPVPVERIVTSGGAARVIVETAKGAELVVVGSRGLGGFKGLLLGSVSQQVTHHAPCPVVVVPPAIDSPLPGG